MSLSEQEQKHFIELFSSYVIILARAETFD
jgi:hypothetical protein